MVTTNETEQVQPLRSLAASDLAWRRAGKVFILLHAIVAACTCFIGLEYLVGWRWVPPPIYIAVKAVAMFGMLPLLVLSPVVSVRMISRAARHHREWLYLGLCDIALLVLQIISAAMASQ
jgi:hypothetical protein